MGIEFSIYNFIILLGGIQGMILCVVLLTRKKNQKPNFFLSILVFILALVSLDLFAGDSNFFKVYRQLISVPTLYFGAGPAIYFFVYSSLYKDFRVTFRTILHFIPVIVEAIYYLTTVLWMSREFLDIHFEIIEPVESYSGMISLATYIVFSFLVIRNSPAIENSQKKGLRYFLVYISIIGLFWAIIYTAYEWGIVLSFENDPTDLELFFPVLFTSATFIYTIGFSNYYRGDLKILEPETIRNSINKPKLQIPEKQVQDYLQKLDQAMLEGRVYQNSDLTLTQLSKELDINQKYLSHVINTELGQSFTDYINSHRIKEFKERIVDPQFNHLTIFGVAMDVGFNSKSAFNRAFKKNCDLSPKEYRDKYSLKTQKTGSDS